MFDWLLSDKPLARSPFDAILPSKPSYRVMDGGNFLDQHTEYFDDEEQMRARERELNSQRLFGRVTTEIK